MLEVIRYIIRKNKGLNIVKYLFFGVVFQIYKRATGNIVSKHIFNGKSLFLYPKCTISTMYAYTDIPDKEEVLVLRNLIENNKDKETIFFDIGANIGSYSVSIMDICKHIVAFEPHPYTSKRCKMNFLLNNFSEYDVKQLALSNEVGKIHFSDYGGSSTINHIINDSSGIEVEVTTLDKFVSDNNFSKDNNYIIKVDVEGFEKEVFEGGKEFLKNYEIKGIIFECLEENDVFDILNSYGYVNIQKLSENNYFATKN